MLSLDGVTGGTQGGGRALLCLGCGGNSCAVLEEGVWEVEVHSVVTKEGVSMKAARFSQKKSVGGFWVWRFPPSFGGDDGRGSCIWPWGAFVHLSGTSACLWLQHESTFGVLPCVGWVETARRLCGFLAQRCDERGRGTWVCFHEEGTSVKGAGSGRRDGEKDQKSGGCGSRRGTVSIRFEYCKGGFFQLPWPEVVFI